MSAKPADTSTINGTVNLPDRAAMSDEVVATSESQPDQPKRVQSTELVAEIVNNASPNTITRDEVLHAMTREGHTDGMKDPKNSIHTALYRAERRGMIRRVARDTFQALDAQDTTQPAAEVQTDLGLQDSDQEGE